MSTQTKDQLGITRTTLIDAPVEKVFAYYSDPEKLPEVWPSLVEVSGVETDANDHPKSFKWVYKMAGMHFSGETENTVFEPDRRYVAESRGGISSTIETVYEDRGGKTELAERVTYSIPIPLLGKVARRFLEKLNENELETIHANLKARLESAQE